MTLAFEDANSKLVKVVTVADVDAMKCVDDSLVIKLNFVPTLSLKLKFKRIFETEV